LEGVIFNTRLPLYEKRKRLEILLVRPMEDWIATDFSSEDEKRKQEVSLLRADCTLREKEGCSGRCVWRRGSGATSEEGGEGRCLLHVPSETQLGEETTKVSAPRVLLLRLIEELLRYGERRRQLLEQDVSQMAALERPITLPAPGGAGGKQKIFPEKSTAWFELLRLDWARKADERPKFLEEMSRAAEAAGPLAEEEPDTALPVALQSLLGGPEPVDPKVGALRLLRAPLASLLAPLGISAQQLSIQADSTAFEEAQLRELTRMTGRIIVQINTVGTDQPVISAKKPFRIAYPTIPVFIVTEEGPALLVMDPAQPDFLKKEDMPKGLASIVEKAKGVLGMRAAAPPAAPKLAAKPAEVSAPVGATDAFDA
jgi:hypothetical protein